MKRVRETEGRYLARGVLGVIGTAAALGMLWQTAWAPGALAGPGRLLLQGDAEGAKQAYVSLATGLGSDETRAEALWRGALLTATDLNEPLGAIQMLQDLVAQHPGSPRAIEARAEMARVHRDQLDQPGRAAPLWANAAELAPEHPSAGTWLLEAGKSYEDAGAMRDAIATLELATRYDVSRAGAHLALGSLLLTADSDASVMHYTSAIDTAPDETLRRVARLGLATALEHENEYEKALAQLALVQPDAVVRHRKERLAGLLGGAPGSVSPSAPIGHQTVASVPHSHDTVAHTP
jgi:tetratricopeptide (TPR) repeat protein